ncbi:MAG: prenyltransferase [bacterium]
MVRNWIEVLRTCNLPEGSALDPVSKWLIITRSCVFSMTVISAFVGGMLAAIDGSFSLGLWLLVTAGLVLAHAANNMVNDLFDEAGGVDTADYPRANYAPHPILDRLVTRNQLIAAIVVCNVLDFLIALYLAWERGWAVMAFAVAGLLTSVFYVAPPLKLKHRGLGEPAIFLIWGPLMIAGTYYVLAGSVSAAVWLASIPYGLAVTTALMCKHLDKADKDEQKGVRTLPVLLGRRRAQQATALLVWGFYLFLVGLVACGILPWLTLLALLSLPKASRVLVALQGPVPTTSQEAFDLAEDVIPEDMKKRFKPGLPLESYPLWPLWYVVWAVWWTRNAGAWFVVGLLLAAIARGLFG